MDYRNLLMTKLVIAGFGESGEGEDLWTDLGGEG